MGNTSSSQTYSTTNITTTNTNTNKQQQTLSATILINSGHINLIQSNNQSNGGSDYNIKNETDHYTNQKDQNRLQLRKLTN
jgi:hypothetical protein